MFCWVVFRISADVTPSNAAAVAEIGLLDGSGSMRDVARRYLSAQKTLPRAGATPPFHKLIMLSQQAGAFGSQLENREYWCGLQSRSAARGSKPRA